MFKFFKIWLGQKTYSVVILYKWHRDKWTRVSKHEIIADSRAEAAGIALKREKTDDKWDETHVIVKELEQDK